MTQHILSLRKPTERNKIERVYAVCVNCWLFQLFAFQNKWMAVVVFCVCKSILVFSAWPDGHLCGKKSHVSVNEDSWRDKTPTNVSTWCVAVGVSWELEDSCCSGSRGSRLCRQGSSSQPLLQDTGLNLAVLGLEEDKTKVKMFKTTWGEAKVQGHKKFFMNLQTLEEQRSIFLYFSSPVGSWGLTFVRNSSEEKMKKTKQKFPTYVLNKFQGQKNSGIFFWLTSCYAVVAWRCKVHAVPIGP